MTAPSRRLHVIVPTDAGLGFALAGIRIEEVERARAAAILRERIADPAVGVLALEASLLPFVSAESKAHIAREGLPVLLPFSLPHRHLEEGGGEDYVAAMIREAIGYHIKVGGAR